MKAWLAKLLMFTACFLNVAVASELLVPSLNQEAWLNAPRSIEIVQTQIASDELKMPEEPSVTPLPVMKELDLTTDMEQDRPAPSETDFSSLLQDKPPQEPLLEKQELIDALNQLPKDQRDFIEGFIDSDLFFVVELTQQNTLTQEQMQMADTIALALTGERQTVTVTIPGEVSLAVDQQIQNWVDYLRNKAGSASITIQKANEKQRPILQNRRVFVTIEE